MPDRDATPPCDFYRLCATLDSNKVGRSGSSYGVTPSRQHVRLA